METFYIFLKGFTIGLSVAAMIGPIAMLCIKKTLDNGWLSGFSIGLGAALADGTYGAVAAFGLTGITFLLNDYSLILKVIGGSFLLYLGINGILTIIKNEQIKTTSLKKNKGFLGNLIITYSLVMTNPATIIIFMSIFAGIGLSEYKNPLLSFIMVIGFFLGSLLFYLIMSTLVNYIKHKISDNILKIIHFISSLIIIGFGVFSFISIF